MILNNVPRNVEISASPKIGFGASVVPTCSVPVIRLENPVEHIAIPRLNSLKELLINASKGDAGIVFVTGSVTASGSTVTTNLTYRELMNKAAANAPMIRRAAESICTNIVLIHFDDQKENIETFWSVIFAGLLPVMSTPLPANSQHRTLHLEHLKSLLGGPLCVTSPNLLRIVPELKALDTTTWETLELSTHDEHRGVETTPYHQESSLPTALMLTSGSTGNAKAVSLSLDQIVASVVGKSDNWKSDKNSVFLNWIGLDHVANLVEMHMQAMLCGARQIQVNPPLMLQDPLLFLRLIDEHRVNYTFAPNFFLALLDKEISLNSTSKAIRGMDLSCLRSIMSGGEANLVDTANSLTHRLHSLNAHGQIIRLGFGMTESCAACVYGMLDPDYEAAENRQFASIGKSIATAQTRVMVNGRLADPYEQGDLELGGLAIFKEYFRNPAATREAFTTDGWFRTGDRAYYDSKAQLNLVGRAKEVLNINGVKFAPVDIESLLENANLRNVIASYFAIFPDRSNGQQTEGYCITLAINEMANGDILSVAEEVARIASSVVSLRPNWIIPLPASRFDKSSLGKLSRTKIQTQFMEGTFDDVKIQSSHPLLLKQVAPEQLPRTAIEREVVDVLSEMTEVPVDLIATDATIFEIGLTSVSMFRFERLLRQRLRFGSAVSIITFLSNPVISAIASAIENEESKIYNPVAQIQSKGSKTPLWLCHPASGNVLAFLPLARTVTDRPLYALTCRGLRRNESLFSSISEMCDTYYKHVKRVQPVGPYALTGYSLGTTVAFELAKRLEADGKEVAFCAALDSPPHVIPLVQNLDWTAAAVLVSYFLELIAQPQVPELIAAYRGLTHMETVKRLLETARPSQRQLLSLDPEQLLAIVNVTDNFGTLAKSYHPVGSVGKIDVFYCTPLHSVERSRDKWITDHLSKWQDFSTRQIEFHECEGDHADMLNPTYVQGFEMRLRKVLEARGI